MVPATRGRTPRDLRHIRRFAMIYTGSSITDDCYFEAEQIRRLDPLNADGLLALVPKINERCDTASLTGLLQTLTEKAEAATLDSPHAALATMRDIGLVLGSLKRHSVEPVSVVPQVVPVLNELGRITNMIPRDTVHHYTSWNPDGPRRRMYVGDVQERCLQDAVTHVVPSLNASLAALDALSEMSLRDDRCPEMIEYLHITSNAMVESIDSVMKTVSPIFFAQIMRPYFDEVLIEGKSYLGPAAAQAPLWLIDICVWASDRNRNEYEQFLLHSLQYSLPSWREFHARHCNKPSLVTRTVNEIERAGPPSEGLSRTASNLTELLKLLKTFRGRHIGMAARAYADGVALFEHGSGGAPVALLRQILDLTRENESVLKESLQRSQHQTGYRHAPAPRVLETETAYT
ncbi:monodechloroaminopyrrolnitrin synthase PrnB family protein [Lysobacter sp. K5869]|uniref:monodechloroaminopyrrolnitrin synthase PrnB family protein n=1 Tax=Lysobacter sp. K5869 TaxID=2820808 RepID=UPI0021015B2A|nr:monodechloroaminopyrrolnitrin synthase PrnB family protein [Lysobacter sp. K5869]